MLRLIARSTRMLVLRLFCGPIEAVDTDSNGATRLLCLDLGTVAGRGPTIARPPCRRNHHGENRTPSLFFPHVEYPFSETGERVKVRPVLPTQRISGILESGEPASECLGAARNRGEPTRVVGSSQFFCTAMDPTLMVPQHTMCSTSRLPCCKLILFACLAVGSLSGGWLIAHNRSGGHTASELGQPGSPCPAIAGPGLAQTQVADRLVGGGGSASLSIAKPRSGNGLATRVTSFLADGPRGSTVHSVAMHTAQLPWVLVLSVCLQV